MSVDDLYNFANVIFLASLGIGLLASILVIFSGRERDKLARHEIVKLHRESELAKERAELANERAALANERAAQLEKEVAIAKLETERLKHVTAQRRISILQHQQIVSELRGKSLDKIWVECPGRDHEASQFHQDIYQTLEDAGLSIQWYSGWERIVGLSISNFDSPTVQALKTAFANVGINFEDRGPTEMAKSGEVEIIIGSKRPTLISTNFGQFISLSDQLPQSLG